MKKVLFGFLLLISSSVFSASVGTVTYVNGFYGSAIKSTALFQSITGANNSCGPTSALLVSNYYYNKIFKTPYTYTTDLILARKQLATTYSKLGLTYNSTTSTSQLKSMAINKWGWATGVIAPAGDINANFLAMVSRFSEDNPVIVALNADYSRNPLKGWKHIVVLYAYDSYTDSVYAFDPYYGQVFYIPKTELSSAIQGGSLSYLRIAP